MISVIMPVFNEGKYLVDCLQSILSQSFSEWELHAVDDFSTDDSLEILHRFAKEDSRIYVHSNIEKGIVPALELAYAKSKGQYLSRMDADDKMHPHKLKLMHESIHQNPEVCVTAMVEYFADYEVAAGFVKYATWLNDLTLTDSHYDEIYKECVVASPCWMMHRATIDRIGGICSGSYPEDYDLIFRLYENNVPIQGIHQVLHYWRDHAERASRNDPHYADQGFIDLKLRYIEKLELPNASKVVLWGAGSTGKLWAKALKEKNLLFSWVTDNPNKVGKDIYQVRIEPIDIVQSLDNALILIAIKSPAFYEENAPALGDLRENNRVLNLY